MSTMTLTELHDVLRNAGDEKHAIGSTMCTVLADALDAHLAQPAQAVDVGAIREVIKRLEEHPLSDEWKVFDQCADKLTRALAGEKSPQTLADFVNLPDAERVAVGQQVAAAVDVAMGEKAGPVVNYRLLGPNDVVEPDDEFIDDNAVDWVRAGSASGGHLFIGMQYRFGVLKQARRPLPASPAPDKGGA